MRDEILRIGPGERSVPRAVEEPRLQPLPILAVLRRRKWSVLAVTAVVVGGVLASSLLRPPTYESETEVLVRAINLIPTEPSAVAAVNMKVEQRVAMSAKVRERADAKLDRRGVTIEEVSVDVAPSDFTLRFTAAAPEPEAARRTAEAFAESYLELRRRQALDDLAAARKPFQLAIDANNRRLRSLHGQIAATGEEAQRTALQTELESVAAEQISFKQSLNRLVLPADLQVGQMLQSPTRPRSLTSPNPGAGALVLLLGLLLGVGLAFLRDQLDQQIRSWEQLKVLVRAPVLAVMPRRSQWGKYQHAGADPESDVEFPQAYEGLSRNVLGITSRSPLKFLMITSPDGNGAKTELTANLGVALAKAQKRIVIVGAEHGSSRLGQQLGLPDMWAAGKDVLSETTDTISLQNVVAHCWVLRNNLFLLPLPEDLERLAEGTWKDLRAYLEEVADIILVDSAPILDMDGDSTLAAITDGVLMVVDAKRTTRSSVQEARQQLDHVGVALVGTVLVKHGAARSHGDDRRHGGRRELDVEQQPAERPESVEIKSQPVPAGPDELRLVEAEVLQLLHSHRPATNGQSHPSLVVMTVDRANEGNSTVAVNLASSLAAAGKRIAVVDLDLRHPVQRRFLDLLKEAGFAEVTSDEVSPERTIHRFTLLSAKYRRSDPDPNDDTENHGYGYVEVLTADALPPDSAQAATGLTAQTAVEAMRDRADVVLVDVPPARRVSDAMSLLPAVDALVEVTHQDRVRMRPLNQLRPALNEPSVPSLGAVTEASTLPTREADAPKPIAGIDADIWLAAVMVTVGAITLLLAFADVKTVLQPVVTLLFLGFGPGAAFVGLAQGLELPVKIMASIALSLAIDAVIAQAMIWSDVWSPKAGLVLVVSLSMIGFALQFFQRLRKRVSAAQGARP
jgi:polysaccharide biosynthesis transport protein